MECIFCKIVEGLIPADKVFEDESILAFSDVNPQAPTHLLVIPKKHLSSILEFGPADDKLLLDLVRVTGNLARQFGLDVDGFRVVNNMGPQGGQAVDHVHFHLLGGRKMAWPPG